MNIKKKILCIINKKEGGKWKCCTKTSEIHDYKKITNVLIP